MKYNGIKYHLRHGMHIGVSLDKIGPIVSYFNENTPIDDVNKILELYNIYQIFNVGIRHKDWDNDFIEKLAVTVKKFPQAIGIFLANLNDENISNIISNVSQQYIDDFWELFSKYNVFTKISPKVFISCLSQPKAALSYILKHKEIVIHYDKELANFMRTSPQTAPILIGKFLKRNDEEYSCHLPQTLLSEEFEEIINKYIDSDNFTSKSLDLIYQGQSSKKFPISDKLRQKAIHALDKYFNENKDKMTFIDFGVSVSFKDQREISIFKERERDGSQNFSYDLKWFEQNLDYPTILNNFIYVFEMFDICCRSTLISLESEIGAIESMFMANGIKFYPVGQAFKMKTYLANLQIALYSDFLKKRNIDFENIFKWFFEEYLVQEFGVSGFCFQNSSLNTTFIERNKNLATEMEGVIKQFRMFIQDKQIDRELFEMSSEPICFESIPSLLKRKYCYPSSQAIQNDMYYLFSDQTLLSWPQNSEHNFEEYSTLFELLIKEKEIKITDFDEQQTESINWLINRGCLKLIQEEQYLLMEYSKVAFLKDIYDNGYTCIYYNPHWENMIDRMIASGDIREKNTLFSEQEADYLNYELNKSVFSNGLDLRNKYAHSSYSRDEKQQQMDYMELLKLMILVITKINDEFCFWNEENKSF